jgi:Family of unknown function (DUF6049)
MATRERADERVGEAAQHPGTTPARVWLRRTAATLAGAVVLTGLVRLPAATAAPQASAATGSRAATVTVDSLTPAVPVKGDTLKITGTVTNDSSSAITAVHVGLRLGLNRPLSSRSAVGNVAASGNYSYEDGNEIPGHTANLPNLAAHHSASFTIDMPVHSLGLGSSGVYELGVAASGTTRDAGYTHVVGIERTYLPWYDHAAGKKVKTTFLWPLIDRPHMDIRSPSGDDEQPPIFRDDDLASELAPGGRLQQLVELGRTLPVTWVIDPDLLATVEAMTRPYQVDGPDGSTTHTTAGTGTADAKQWLNDLQSAIQGRQVVALPFGDPDLAAIAHNGSGVPGTIGHLKSATDLADVTVQTILGVTPRTDFAWPADGAVDPSVINVAKAGGADKIIASSGSFPESSALPYTPTAARPVGGGTTAIAADATLSDAFAGSMKSAGAATQARQRFLAQSLMIYEQAPQQQRSIVVAPQRNPSAQQAQAMADAISAALSGGWAEPIDLTAAATQPTSPGVNEKVPSTRSYPQALRRQELSPAAFRQIQNVQDALNSFLVILSVKDRVTTPFGNAILGSMSTEWRGKPYGAGAFRADISAYLTDLTGLVHIIGKQSITLSGRTATIPVTVENSLAQQVSGLTLRLTSTQSNRLDPGPGQSLAIDGGHNRSLKFRTTARANGKAWVKAQLYTADGTPYGQPMTFEVNVTSITDTVMLVIAGGLLLLVLAGVRMYRQRKRLALLAGTERPAADTEGTRETDDSDDTDEAGQPVEGGGSETAVEPVASTQGAPTVPGQAGDLAPDTAAEGAGPSAQGEKVER